MLQVDGPTLSPMLKRLEAAGLVTRTRDPDDERQLRIDLTEQGRDLRRQALNVPPAVVAKLGMSLGDLMELHKSLTELNAAARRAGVTPLPVTGQDSVLPGVTGQDSGLSGDGPDELVKNRDHLGARLRRVRRLRDVERGLVARPHKHV